MNAVVEVRFRTTVQPSLVPGLFFGAVRDKYPRQSDLPQNQVPDEIRAVDPMLRYLPTVVFPSEQLSLYVGPRVFFFAMGGTEYPGWSAYLSEFQWLCDKIRSMDVVQIPERGGLRYVDFFDRPIQDCLQVDVVLGGVSQSDASFQFMCQRQRESFVSTIQVNNAAILDTPKGARVGCTLDIDLGFGLDPARFWDVGVSQFEDAHNIQKELFFSELLNPRFLQSLSPKYE